MNRRRKKKLKTVPQAAKEAVDFILERFLGKPVRK